VIALQALTEYAFRGRLKDITDMSITLELPSTAGFRKTVHIDNTSFTDIQMFEVGHTDMSYCYITAIVSKLWDIFVIRVYFLVCLMILCICIGYVVPNEKLTD
jgi:hypothetical protein